MAHRDINRNEVDIEIDMTKVEMGQHTINMYTEAKGTEDGSGATRTPTEVGNDEMEALTHSSLGRAAAPKRMMSCRTKART